MKKLSPLHASPNPPLRTERWPVHLALKGRLDALSHDWGESLAVWRRRSNRAGRRGACLLALCAGLQAVAAGPVPVAAAQQPNEPPLIQHDPPSCGSVGARVRLCAYVVDETGIAQVRATFRAQGVAAYHWTPMDFDGALYCAQLPAALRETRAVEYYVEAIDDRFEPSRTADYSYPVRADCPAPAGEPAAKPALVGTTLAKQPPAPAGFDPATFTPR